LAFITSKIPDELLETDIVITAKEKGFELSGLRVTSTLRLHRMITVTSSIIRRDLGQLPEPQQEAIKNKLRAMFDLG
jgi:mRNA interferase MazF